MSQHQLIETAVQWAEKQGFTKIRANFEDYEVPTQFSRQGQADVFVPDITGVKMGRKFYVEIAMKTDDIRRKVSKWNLLGTMASLKGGKLYLLAPKGHKTFTEDLVKRHNLNAKVIYLKN